MSSRTAFVTGASGFFGANLVRELLAQNWKVIAFHRPSSNLWRLKGLEIELRSGSFFEQASLDQALPENVDAIFHAAAKVSFWRSEDALMKRDNVEATKLLLDAATRRKTKRFIFTSTAGVYGYSNAKVDEKFVKEGLRSKSGYLRTKAEAELEVLKAVNRGLDAVILNPATIVGPLDNEHWGLAMRKIKASQMKGTPPGASSFVHVAEAAKAHVAAFEKGKPGRNYILAGTNATYLELFHQMEEILGLTPKLKPIPEIALQIFAELSQLASHVTHKAPLVTPELLIILAGNTYCDSRRAMAELGLKPKSLEEMLRDCWNSLPPA
jgi:dihydroflavonol-4-reductase